MSKYIEKECPKCGQQLRFPSGVGGVVMVCPSCGKKFYSDFKVRLGNSRKGTIATIFEMPETIVERIISLFKK